MERQRRNRIGHPVRRTLAIILVAAQVIMQCPETVFASETIGNISADNAVTAEGAGKIGTSYYNDLIKAEFSYPSFLEAGDIKAKKDGKDLSDVCYYTDDYFREPATDYTGTEGETQWKNLKNHSLATASLCLAMSAFGSNIDNYSSVTKTTDYTKKYRNGEALLSKLGFEEIYHNDWFTKKPDSDSIGVIIAQKEIELDEGSYTLRAVAIRGAGYESEWASNLTIGLTEEGHQGFNEAATQVVKEVENYHKAHKAERNVKYWIVGYSRAGATANLTSGKITDRAGEFGSKKEDIYGYTFEAPQGAAIVNGQKSIQQLKYRNIHNIINKLDLVPMVSPWQFGHQRLGIDYVLPCHSNVSSSEYSDYKSAMKSMLSKDSGMEKAVENYPDNRPIDIYTFNISPWADRLEKRNGTKRMGDLGGQVYMDDLIAKLMAKVSASNAWGVFLQTIFTDNTIAENKQYYVDDYQHDLRRIVKWAMSGELGKPGAFRTVISAIFGVGVAVPVTKMPGGLTANLAAEISSVAAQPKWLQSVLYPARLKLYASIASFAIPFFTVYDGFKMGKSITHVTPVFTELFLNDRSKYEQNYLGTLLNYSGDLFTTHVPEVTLAWMKSLDRNYNLSTDSGSPGMTQLRLGRQQISKVEFFRNGESTPFAVYTGDKLYTRDNSVWAKTNTFDKSSLWLHYLYKDVTVKIVPNNNYDKFSFNATSDKTAKLDQAYVDPMAGKDDIFELSQNGEGAFSLKRKAHITFAVEGVEDTSDNQNFKRFLADSLYTADGDKNEKRLTDNDLMVAESAKLNMGSFTSGQRPGIGTGMAVKGYYVTYDDKPDVKVSEGTCEIAGALSISQSKETFKTDRSRTYHLLFEKAPESEQRILVENSAKLYNAETGKEADKEWTTDGQSSPFRTLYKVKSGTRVCILPSEYWMNRSIGGYSATSFNWYCSRGDIFFDAMGISDSDYALTFTVPQFADNYAAFGMRSYSGRSTDVVTVKALRLKNAAVYGTEKITPEELRLAGITIEGTDQIVKIEGKGLKIYKSKPVGFNVTNIAQMASGKEYSGYYHTGWSQGFYNDESCTTKKEDLNTIEIPSEITGKVGENGQTGKITLAAADEKGTSTEGSYICIEPSLKETGVQIVVLNGRLTYNGKDYENNGKKNANTVVIGAGKEAALTSTDLTADDLLRDKVADPDQMTDEEKKTALKEYGLDPAGYKFTKWVMYDGNGTEVTSKWITGSAGSNYMLKNPLSQADLNNTGDMAVYYLTADYSENNEKISLKTWTDNNNVTYWDYGLIEVTGSDGRTAYYGAGEEAEVHFGDYVTLGAGVHPFKATRDAKVENSRYDLTKGWTFETITDKDSEDKDLYFSSWILRDGQEEIDKDKRGNIRTDVALQTFTMPHIDTGNLQISLQSSNWESSHPAYGRKVVNLSIESGKGLEGGYFRADNSQPLTKDTVLQGSRIDLYAPEASGNKSFYCWQAYTKDKDGMDILYYLDDLNAEERNTSFTMPYEDITLKPVYLSDADTVTIKTVNGKVLEDRTVRPGDIINLQANAEGAKESFIRWESSDPSVLLTTPDSVSTKAVIPGNTSGKTIVLTAKFESAKYIITEIPPIGPESISSTDRIESIITILNRDAKKTIILQAKPVNGGDTVSVKVPVEWKTDEFRHYEYVSGISALDDKKEFAVSGTMELAGGTLVKDGNPCILKLGEGMTRIVTQRFRIQDTSPVTTPLPNYEAGTYTAPATITISNIMDGTYGYYTIDGKTPEVDWKGEKPSPSNSSTRMIDNGGTITLTGKPGKKVEYTLKTEACAKWIPTEEYITEGITMSQIGRFEYVIDRTAEAAKNRTITIKDAAGETVKIYKNYKTGDDVFIYASSQVRDPKLAFSRWSADSEDDRKLIEGKETREILRFDMPARDVVLTVNALQKIDTAYIDFGDLTIGNLPDTAIWRVQEDAPGVTVYPIWRKIKDTNLVYFSLYPKDEALKDPDKYAKEFVKYNWKDEKLKNAVTFYVKDGSGDGYRQLSSAEIRYGETFGDGRVSLELKLNVRDSLKFVPVYEGEKEAANGTAIENILPGEVTVTLASGKNMTVSTPANEWILKSEGSDYSYDPAKEEEQAFTAAIDLTAKLTEAGIVVPQGTDATVSVNVKVKAKPELNSVKAVPAGSMDDRVYNDSVTVKLSNDNRNAKIYYSISQAEDGVDIIPPSNPAGSDNEMLYDDSTGIVLPGVENKTIVYNIKTIAVADGYKKSSVSSFTYTIRKPVSPSELPGVSEICEDAKAMTVVHGSYDEVMDEIEGDNFVSVILNDESLDFIDISYWELYAYDADITKYPDLPGAEYDPDDPEEQKFLAVGQPKYITDEEAGFKISDFINNNLITRVITVKAAEQSEGQLASLVYADDIPYIMMEADENASIYYNLTMDGSEPPEPTQESPLYDGKGIRIEQSGTAKIRSIAVEKGKSKSEVGSFVFEGVSVKYPVTVTAFDGERGKELGFASYDEAGNKTMTDMISLSCVANETVRVSAPSVEGYVFDNWEAEGIIITQEDSKELTLSFNMPQTEVKLKANYMPLISDIVLTVSEIEINTKLENEADSIMFSLGDELFEMNPDHLILSYSPDDDIAQPATYYKLKAELLRDTDENDRAYVEIRRIYADEDGNITEYGNWERYYGGATVLANTPASIGFETTDATGKTVTEMYEAYVSSEESGGLSSIEYVFDITDESSRADAPDPEKILSFNIDYEEELFVDNDGIYELYIPIDGESTDPEAQAAWDGTQATNYPLYDLTDSAKGKTVYVRVAETENQEASEWVSVTLPNRAAAISGNSFAVDYDNEAVKLNEGSSITEWQSALTDTDMDIEDVYSMFYGNSTLSGNGILYLVDAGYEEDTSYESEGAKLYVRTPADPGNRSFAGAITEESAISIPKRQDAPKAPVITDISEDRPGTVEAVFETVQGKNVDIEKQAEDGSYVTFKERLKVDGDGKAEIAGIPESKVTLRFRLSSTDEAFASKWVTVQDVTVTKPAKKTDAKVSITGRDISEGKLTMTYGEELSLQAIAEDKGTNGNWIVSSDTPSVVTVNKTDGQDENIGLALSAKAAGKAVIEVSYESETTVGSASLEVTVNKKEATISGITVVNKSKVYDGTEAVEVNMSAATINGILDADQGKVKISEGYAAYEDKNAGTDKTVSFHDYSLTGEKSDNYTLTGQPDSLTADIEQKPVSIKVSAKDRQYIRGNVSVELTLEELTGIVEEDDAYVDGRSLKGSMINANPGKEKSVECEEIRLTGSDADNYRITEQPKDLKVNIGKASLSGGPTAEIVRSYLYNKPSSESIDLTEVLPVDSGKISFGNPTVEGDLIFETAPSVKGSVISYELKDRDNKASGSVVVTATMQNYEDCQITVSISQDEMALYEKAGKENVPASMKDLAIGKSFTFIPEFVDRVVSRRVVWASSNPDVATVTQKGKVTAMSRGTTLITVRSEEDPTLVASCNVSVTEPVTEVILNYRSCKLGTGEGITLNATVLPKEMNKKLEWSFSKDNVIEYEVSDDTTSVTITGKALGNTKITVAATDGSKKKATCSVTVGNPVYGFSVIGKGNAKTVMAGKDLKMNVVWTGLKPKNEEVIWSLSACDDEKGDAASVASISPKGVLTGITPGKVKVTATSVVNPAKTAYAEIEVTAPKAEKGAEVTGIRLINKTDLGSDALVVGKSYTVKTDLTLNGKGKAASNAIAWYSSDTNVATVTQKGVIKTVGPGTATITAVLRNAEDKEKAPKDSVTIKVCSIIKSVKTDKTKLTVGTQEGSRYGAISLAKINPVNASDTAIEWKSNNGNIMIAAVDEGQDPSEGEYTDATGSGLTGTAKAKGNGVTVDEGQYLAVMAVNPGVTKLTGITKDGSNKKVTCTVTVRGQVTKLMLKHSEGSKGFNNVTWDMDAGKYRSNMKAGTGMKLIPLVDINGISAVSADKTDRKLYSAYKKYTDLSVSYRSSDTKVATVDDKGKVSVKKGVAPGTTVTIHVVSNDGQYERELEIIVK